MHFTLIAFTLRSGMRSDMLFGVHGKAGMLACVCQVHWFDVVFCVHKLPRLV